MSKMLGVPGAAAISIKLCNPHVQPTKERYFEPKQLQRILERRANANLRDYAFSKFGTTVFDFILQMFSMAIRFRNQAPHCTG